MRHFLFATLLSVFSAALVATTIAANTTMPLRWIVAADESAIQFEYSEDDQVTEGRFTRFEATGFFNPELPEAARFVLTIEIDSMELPDVLRESVVKGVGWFEVERFPDARYELTHLKALADGSYEATGRLRIKDETREITTPVALEIDPERARARGRLIFDRGDFKLGGGPEELFFDIGDEIAVSFDLLAAPRR